MGNLSKLQLKPSYHKGTEDIAEDFYLPCMSSAVRYDRAVGFFSSSIYVIAWQSLRGFVERSGAMRIICSPMLSPDDIHAIDEGYVARTDLEMGNRLRQEIQKLLANPFLRQPTRVLASLVALGIVEVRIAYPQDFQEARYRRLFHDKVGIFSDELGNSVVFKGSMNETWSGLSSSGNLESVDVYVSWLADRDAQRVRSEKEYFEKLWANEYPSLSVEKFPEIALQELIRAADTSNWQDMVDQICAGIDENTRLSADKKPGGRRLRPHQLNALQTWFERGRRGILEHATGSGKTYTALSAIRDALLRKEVPIILVPSRLLFEQWYQEIKDTFEDLDLKILRCGSGHIQWKQQNLLYRWTKPSEDHRIIIATLQTAASSEFIANVSQGEHLFLVVDEVHRLGSTRNQHLLQLETGPRLGLSATPRRAGDPQGTKAIFDYFSGVIPPPFTLGDAIAAGSLTPYIYYVHSMLLSDEEQKRWDQYTNRIRQIYAQYGDNPVGNAHLLEKAHLLLIRRARIVKGAKEKASIAGAIVAEHFQPGKRQQWIVYCDSRNQLDEVLEMLKLRGIDAQEYHSQMQGNKERTLRDFELNGGAVVSIRCLDEGVDIPSVTHALILASSKNPREFIQRRGRVLRRFPGKHLAFIHDLLVLPGENASIEQGTPSGTAILEGELARAIEFGKMALNPGAITELQRIADRYALDIGTLIDEGFEDESD